MLTQSSAIDDRMSSETRDNALVYIPFIPQSFLAWSPPLCSVHPLALLPVENEESGDVKTSLN